MQVVPSLQLNSPREHSNDGSVESGPGVAVVAVVSSASVEGFVGPSVIGETVVSSVNGCSGTTDDVVDLAVEVRGTVVTCDVDPHLPERT